MSIYEIIQKENIDLSSVGFFIRGIEETYYCTPKDANILAWAGTDGIHYCTVPQFGDMIFAVSPMNVGDCVHPIAKSFEDLLRLLLSCVDMAVLEQCYAWDREQYKAFLQDCPATEDQQKVLDRIRCEFHLEPMEDTFTYVKELQAEFDLSKIPYKDDDYDLDTNPAEPERCEEWSVTYGGGFWRHEGTPCREVKLHKSFQWDCENWYVPSIYISDQGLVIDFLIEVDLSELRNFITKWDLYNEDQHDYTQEQRECIEKESPLHIDFHCEVNYNGEQLQGDYSCGISWLPPSCMADEFNPAAEAKHVLNYYNLDSDKPWVFQRSFFKWNGLTNREPETIEIRMIRNMVDFYGSHFVTPETGANIEIKHPVSGQKYKLTVHKTEQAAFHPSVFRNPQMEYPTHYLTMLYTMEPEVEASSFLLRDVSASDQPRMINPNPDSTGQVIKPVMAVGSIAGADGPTANAMSLKQSGMHAAGSAMHFETVSEVEWVPVFRVKTMEDVFVKLI